MSNENSAGTWRAFIAIAIPEAVKTEMGKAQAELRQALPHDRVRWTKREQFHLTLKFLGHVAVNRIEPLIGSVREACRNFPVLRLRAGRLGIFPNVQSPRVIWAGVEDGEGWLLKLQTAIEAAVQGFSSEEPEGKFTGHVTLGRARGLEHPQAETLAQRVASMAERGFGEWTADQVEMIRSELSSSGARYTTLAALPLAHVLTPAKPQT